MLHLVNLSKSYGNQVLFDNLTCTINPGEKIGLVGRNGSGKTTLFNIILGKTPADTGEVNHPSDYRIGHLEQIADFKSESALEEALKGLHRREYGDEWKAKKLLAGLGFSEKMMESAPSILSSGYKIRLNLAKLILSDPNLLLLDEPNNYLDIVSIRWLINYLKDWKKELIIISHDRNFLEQTTDYTILIHREQLRKFNLTPSESLAKIAEEEEVHEKTRLNYEKKREQTEEYIRRFRAKARMAKSVQSAVKALEKQEAIVKLDQIRGIDFAFQSKPLRSPSVMTLEDISFSYSNSPLFKNLNLEIGSRDRICVTGKNGIGKTTLLRIMAGDLEMTGGSIKTHPSIKIARYLEADIPRLNPRKTVYDEIFDSSDRTSRENVRSICGALMFSGDDALKKISVLSGGEKSRVLLGKVLTTPCNLLLLDEPTNHLDMESTEALLEAIKNFEGAVVMVTHNEWLLKNIAERILVFKPDRVRVFEGGYNDFLRIEGWEEGPDSKSKSQVVSKKKKSKREIKRIEASIRQKRFKAIEPLEKKIKFLEKKIEKLEEEKVFNTNLLIEASEKADAQKIKEASQNESRLNEDIEKLYTELENLLTELDEKSIFYETKLKKIQEE